MSYSHAVDRRLAPALQSALQQFAKPWYRLRAIRIFRDDTSLSVTDRLWGSIEQALGGSEFFLLLASPAAAASEWVDREVAWWLEHRSAATLFIVLTDGELTWDGGVGDFDTSDGGPLPPALRGAFAEEPRFTDLSFARTADHLALDDPRFADAVADIAATLHGRPKDELVGEDVRQHRRLRRIARGAVATLATLLAVAAVLGLVARDQRDQAASQRDAALSLALGNVARGQLSHRQDVALLVGLEAYRRRADASAESVMQTALEVVGSTGTAGILHGLAGPVSSVAVSPDGRRVASATLGDGTLGLWDARTHRRLGRVLRPHRGQDVLSVAFTPDGHTLVSAGGDGMIRLWPHGDKTPPLVLAASGGAVNAVAVSQDGRTLASSDDAGVDLWRLPDGRHEGATFAGFSGRAVAVAFSPDGHTLAAGTDDGTVALFRLPARRRLGQPLRALDGSVLSVAFSPDGSTLAAGADDGAVRLWSTVTRRPAGPPLVGHGGAVWSVAFGHDGTLATGSEDGAVRLWDLRHPQAPARTLAGHDGSVHSVAFDRDGRTLVSGSDDTTVRIWNLRRRLGQPLARRRAPFVAVAFSPDGRTLAATADDGTTFRFGLASGASLGAPIAGRRRTAGTTARSPDGQTIAVGDGLGRIQLYAPPHRRLGRPLTGHVLAVESLAFSPDGATLASAGQDGTVRLWDVSTRTPIAQLGRARLGQAASGIAPAVHSLAFRPDGRVLASGDDDGVIRLWDVADPRRAVQLGRPLAGHAGPVYGVAFSRDGAILASVGDDGTVRLWDRIGWSDYAGLRRLVCGIVGTGLSRAEWAAYAAGTPVARGCP